MALSPVFVELKASVADLQAKMGIARAEIASLNEHSNTHLNQMAAVGKAAFLGLGAAAIAGSLVAVKAAANYQESLTQLVTGAGESEKNIKTVGDGMLAMAGQVGVGALDLSKGMFMIESAGYHGADGLKVLHAAAEGMKVGGADMISVADGLTTALRDYHIPASQAAAVTSKLVETVALGKTHMADLSGALATVLPAASAAGVGLNQVLGAMATLTSVGTPAAKAATYLRQTILMLANPSAKARAEMENLGLSAIDVSKNLGVRGLSGTLDLLTGAIERHMGPQGTVLIEQMKKAAGHTSQFQQILANLPPTQQTYIAALATMVGGTKSMQAALELTGANAAGFADDVKTISATTTEAGGHVKGFAATQKDLNNQIADAKAAVGALVIELGQVLIPVIETTVLFLEKHKTAALAVGVAVGTVLVGAIGVYITQLTIATARTVASALAMTTGTVTMGARIAAVYAAQAAAAVAAGVAQVASWVSVAAAATAAFIAENIASLGIITAIAAIVAAAIYLYKHWDEVWGFVKSAVQAGVSFVKDHLLIFAVALGPVGIAAALLYKNWSTVWSGIRTVIADVWSFIQPILDGISAAVSRVSDGIGKLASAAGSVAGVVGKVGGVFSHIPGFATGVQNFGGGLAMVGENGPEVVKLPAGSNVYPHGTGPAGPNSDVLEQLLAEQRRTNAILDSLPREQQRLARAS